LPFPPQQGSLWLAGYSSPMSFSKPAKGRLAFVDLGQHQVETSLCLWLGL